MLKKISFRDNLVFLRFIRKDSDLFIISVNEYKTRNSIILHFFSLVLKTLICLLWINLVFKSIFVTATAAFKI